MDVKSLLTLSAVITISTGVVLGSLAMEWNAMVAWVIIVLSTLISLIMIHMTFLNPAESHTLLSITLQYLFIFLIKWIGWFMKRNLLKTSHDSVACQTALLVDILKQRSGTSYGKDFNFMNIKSVDDFRRKLHLTDYDHYKPYIDQIVEKGMSDILFPGCSDFIAMTTGTTSGKSKAFPVSSKVRKALIRKTLVLAFSEILQCLANCQLQKFYFVKINPRVSLTSYGVKKGPISALLEEMNLPFVAFPSYLNSVTSTSESLYINLLLGIREKHIGAGFITTTTLTMTLMKTLENVWQQLCDDLEAGHVSIDLNISDETRASVNKFLNGPNPRRAEELRRIFRSGFQDIITKIWPHCSVVWSLTSGTLTLQAKKIEEKYLGDATLLDVLHGGSEYTYGFNLDPTHHPPSFTLAGNLAFFEFIHSGDISSKQPETKLPGQVIIGEEYELVITSHEGLCRYRTEDVVRITGFCGGFPVYQLVRRVGDVLNLLTERLPEVLLSRSLARVISKYPDVHITDYTSTENFNVEDLTDDYTGQLYYCVFLELDEPYDVKQLSVEVDSDLCDSVEYYDVFRKKGTFQGISIISVEPGTFYSLRKNLLEANQDATDQQYKTPRILRSRTQLKLLFESRLCQ
ncbi:hypothetical protein ScPMuIL_015395 [Solemya velum]